MRNVARYLAVAMTLCACGCSASPEDQALELVAAYGGQVRTSVDGKIVAVDLSDTPAGDDVIAALAVFPTIQTLNCSNANRITGHGFAAWTSQSQLEELYLVGAAIDDHGLWHVSRLTTLKTLQLGHTKITNAGLSALDHLTQLQTLSLSSTAVTDAGLVKLRDLRHLTTLMLRDTGVTRRGVTELRRMLPEVRIVD